VTDIAPQISLQSSKESAIFLCPEPDKSSPYLPILHRNWMCEDRLLRGTFGSKTEEVTGEWRKLHNEELYVDFRLPPRC
jgi:hypothetical protein